MDNSNGIPVVAPTVAPPPGVRPMVQATFPQGVVIPTIGMTGLPTLRPAQFNAGAPGGLPLFQAQPPQAPQQQLQSASSLGRKLSMERAKSAGQSAGPRKQCNCKNSRCLKLYCECFASGRYCDNCNCIQCYNNRENEATRQSAVETILERNPNAFRPKIQGQEQAAAAAAAAVAAAAPGRHLKGCNCKKSFCLKKYCECFQAGIYCSDNCKCVDCKNYEEPSAPGYGGGGSKRVRYSSAPPPQLGTGQPLGLPPHGAGFPGGIVSNVRTGGLGLPPQPGGGVAVGVGLSPGIPGNVVAPLAAGGPTGVRPGGGGLSGLGGSSGALASLPQALSLALVAAGNGQTGPPLIAAPSPAVTGQGGPVPVRSSLYEVVNGMVKRPVIEELCSLLWLVADDEAARGRSGSGGGAPAAGSKAAPRAAVQQPQQAAGTEGSGAAGHSGTVQRDIGGDARRPSTGVDGAVSSARENEAAGAAPMDADGEADGTSRSGDATGPQAAGVASWGSEGGTGCDGAAAPQQPRPGPWYARRERVVLEEFLSIINKISDTAAKKLAQQQASNVLPPTAPQQATATAALHFSVQQQQLQIQFPQQPQQAPHQPLLVPPFPASVQPQTQGQPLLQPPPGQPQSAVVLATSTAGAAPRMLLPQPGASLGVQPPPGQLAVFGAGVASSQPPVVRPPGVPGGQTLVMGGQAGQALVAGPGASQPHFPGGAGSGVPIIRPPLPPGHSAAAASAHSLPGAAHQPHHVHGDVPVILAPPRGGHGAGASAGHQPQHQQPQLLAPPSQPHAAPHQALYVGEQQAMTQSQGAVTFASPFVQSYGAALPTHGASAPLQTVDPAQALPVEPQGAQQAAPGLAAPRQQPLLQQLLADSEPDQAVGGGGSNMGQQQASQLPPGALASVVGPLALTHGGAAVMGYVDGVPGVAGHMEDGSSHDA